MAPGVYRGPQRCTVAPEVYRGPCMKNMRWNSPITYTNVLRLQVAIITDQQKFVTKITLAGCLVSIFTVGINSKSFPWPVRSVQETYLQKSLRRPTRLDGMRHHADGQIGRGLMTSLEQGKDSSFNKITRNWVMNCT